MTYMLRRLLPPWNPDEGIRETVGFCRSHGIDEVAFFDESSNAYHELPTTEEIREKIRWLELAKKNLEKYGINYSINVLTTLGHGDYGGDVAGRFPGIEFMVDITGSVSKSCPCPLSSVWRSVITETYRLYASTHPVRIWVDDDFRLTGHGAAQHACYCPLHLKEFNRRFGQHVTREELVSAILQPGKPHPLRSLWLQFQEDVMVETTTLLRESVHSVSPETQMGWMSTTPFMHEIEQRHMGQQIAAFGGNGTAAIRLATTQYYEGNPRVLLIEDEALKKSIPQIPAGTTFCTEIESMPHFLYNKSAVWIAAQMSWAGVLNIPNHTLNIYDYLGTPTRVVPLLGRMLRKQKTFLRELEKFTAGTSVFRGVRFLSHPYSARFVETVEGKSMEELKVRETGWADVVRGFGMPMVCAGQEDVVAVSGQALRQFDRDGLERIFSRGVLLDLSALRVLQDMQSGDLAGVSIKDEIGMRARPIGPEVLTDPDFGGGKHRFTWTYAPSDKGTVGILHLFPGARTISIIADVDLQPLFPGAVLFENRLGGRVAIYPYDASGKDPDVYNKGITKYFFTEYRKMQMQAVIRWLANGRIPLVVNADGWVLPHRADGEKSILLAAMNLNYDSWNALSMEAYVTGTAEHIELFNPKGKISRLDRHLWSQDNGHIHIRLKEKVPALGIVAVKIAVNS